MNEDIKKQVNDLFVEYAKMNKLLPESLYAKIFKLIRQAKIDENELWIKKCKSNPLSSQEFSVAREAFEERIKKLSELKEVEK